MKLLLLHGSGKSASRIKLTSIKKEFDSLDVLIYEEGFDRGQVLANLSTLPLLSNERLIILENPPEDFTFDSSGFSDSLTLTLWFDRELSPSQPILRWVKENHGQIFYFPESKEVSVFPFLDYLAQGDQKAFLELKKLKEGGFDIYYFITMVFYLLRNLVATPKNTPYFVRDKLQRQRKNFSLENIKGLYKEILEIDFKIKSGLMEKDQAEFLLVNIFL